MDEAKQQVIYNRIKALLKAYSPPYGLREEKNVSGKDGVGLWAEGEFEIHGKKRKEIYFAGIIKQKHYVGFYFTPIYSDPEAMRPVLTPRLLKCLKGKSCFWIKENDEAIIQDIDQALSEGYKLYHGRGWV